MCRHKLNLAFGFRCQHLEMWRRPTGAPPENGDPCLVSPKDVDVPLHPLECYRLVFKPQVPRHHGVLGRQKTCPKETQWVEVCKKPWWMYYSVSALKSKLPRTFSRYCVTTSTTSWSRSTWGENSWALPLWKEPPWRKTITGNFRSFFTWGEVWIHHVKKKTLKN